MFKDLKENINKRNREIEYTKENQIELLKLKIHHLRWTFYWMRLTADYIIEKKISECEGIEIKIIWNNGQNFSKPDEKYKTTGPRISIQLTVQGQIKTYVKVHIKIAEY